MIYAGMCVERSPSRGAEQRRCLCLLLPLLVMMVNSQDASFLSLQQQREPGLGTLEVSG